jgi:hypothetical protein
MTSEQNKAVRSVLTAVGWALKVGVTKDEIIQAIKDLASGAATRSARGIWTLTDGDRKNDQDG